MLSLLANQAEALSSSRSVQEINLSVVQILLLPSIFWKYLRAICCRSRYRLWMQGGRLQKAENGSGGRGGRGGEKQRAFTKTVQSFSSVAVFFNSFIFLRSFPKRDDCCQNKALQQSRLKPDTALAP